VFGAMDWVYQKSEGTDRVAIGWVIGFILLGVIFICVGLWMQFAVGDE
jgi:hypothetical protein